MSLKIFSLWLLVHNCGYLTTFLSKVWPYDFLKWPATVACRSCRCPAAHPTISGGNLSLHDGSGTTGHTQASDDARNGIRRTTTYEKHQDRGGVVNARRMGEAMRTYEPSLMTPF